MKTTYKKYPREGGGDGLPQPYSSYGPGLLFTQNIIKTLHTITSKS